MLWRIDQVISKTRYYPQSEGFESFQARQIAEHGSH
jgi:hypothetical protein